MPKIKQLDPHVADLIAAGEVVERPASVVKELMENAIDAGATSVTVEIQRGGMSYIRVTDNGCGISWEDAETAFLRHATSKIHDELDLEAIGTLGFRGEALAAISAVSKIDLLTRQEGSDFGTSMLIRAGVVDNKEEAGCPVGTTMIVRDLFYNTPARRKFVKRDIAEGNAVANVVDHIALSHPEVAVRFLREGKETLNTPGDGNQKSVLYGVLGRNIAPGLIPVRGGTEEIQVEGYVSLPACCRGTRGWQNFIVNGRWVSSRTMMAALEEAYRNQKMVGKFPACVLYLTIGLGDVDVNVHPSKTEIKFADDRLLFDSVYYTVKNALEESGARLQMTLSPNQEEEDTPKPAPQEAPRAPEKPAAKKNPAQTPFSQSYPGKQNFFQTMSAEQFRESIQKTPDRKDTLPSPPPKKPVPSRDHAQQPASDAPWLIPQPEDELPVLILTDGEEEIPILRLETDAEPEYKVEPLPPNQCLTRLDERESAEEVANQLVHPEEEEAATPVPEPEPVSEPEPAPIPWKVVGELFHTYILVEQGDTVVLIDKHAAHERMNFDRLKAQDYRPMAQQLLTPLVIRPSRQEGRALLDHLSLLEEFGFDLEDFGDGAILVRQVPYDIEPGEAEATLSELAGKLLTTGRLDPSAARDELLHTMACKAAIKGGQKNGPEELQRVAEDVMADRVRYCPHGRPVAIELTRKQLEKQFKRT